MPRNGQRAGRILTKPACEGMIYNYIRRALDAAAKGAVRDMSGNTRVIDGRVHVQGEDGLYTAVPAGMDEARDRKSDPRPRQSVDEATGRTYKVVEPEQMLDYLDKAVRDGAVVSRAYDPSKARGSGEADLRRMVRISDDIAILEPTGKDGALEVRNLTAGDLIDTTDPTAMRGVGFDEFDKDYEIADRYVMFQNGRNTRYLNFEPGRTAFGAGEMTVASRRSLPVNVLFNENDTVGEVVPLEDVTVPCTKPDGRPGTVHINCLDNFVAGHEDLSPRRGDLDPGQENMFKARMTDEMIRADYKAYPVYEELGETRAGILKARLAENPYLDAEAKRIGQAEQTGAGFDGPDTPSQPSRSPKMQALMDQEARRAETGTGGPGRTYDCDGPVD